MAADTLSPHVSDEEETNTRRGIKREGPKKFSRGKYEKIKSEYVETPGELDINQKLARLRDFK